MEQYMPTDAQVILNANLIPGGTVGSPWRRSDAPGSHFITIDHYIEVAKIAERGLLDAVFLADSVDFGSREWNSPGRLLDPLIAQAVLSAHTERIGFVATASTSYNDPYNLARQFASLAAASSDRVAWNIVVSGGDPAARNYSREAALPKAERYERAAEFIEVVTKLWGSWADGALVADKTTGEYLDPTLIDPVDHVGKHFQVQGPLKAPPLSHGRPVLVQAGASSYGEDLAATYADVVYSPHLNADSARERRTALRKLAAAKGREPNSIKLIPGLMTVIADTEEAALRREEELADLIPESVQILNLARTLEVPVESLTLDAPIPWDLMPGDDTARGSRGQRSVFIENVRSRGLDTRGAARLLAAGSGHARVVGTPEQVADVIETWFTEGAVDGFNIMVDELPDGLEVFVDHVVPLLQKRGLHRTEYRGATLREHYGL
ncbi:hypothetical protein AZG88_40765 [Rhodococcus sp. LB1]|nr:hypothetical protein AZG88_40765 [Rhodococcus sp. LB1]